MGKISDARSADAAPLAVTMGEPAGVGGELTLAAWLKAHRGGGTSLEQRPVAPFFAIDDPDRLRILARRLDLDVPIRMIDDPSQTLEVWQEALPVVAHPLTRAVEPGHPAVENVAAITGSIERAATLTLEGKAAGMVTNPVHKKCLRDGGFAYSGHTDFLAALARRKTGDATIAEPVMMMTAPGLRVVPVTIHLPLADAIDRLDRESIEHCCRVVHEALIHSFAVPAPRIAVAGLNPHAGEGGMLGTQEQDIIRPAIDNLAAEGIDLEGPFAADTLFGAAGRDCLDAIVCMYHDQALIPIKTLDFWHTVNVTLGLPFVRTSPGHGTGLNVAGSGTARATSFIAALAQAALLTHRSTEAANLSGAA